ncbi:MAG TPA: hypothetical protein VLW85_19575 [Myxococcales bacterium]|nr:hypothetical protein [Myxococcales bacterium]
MPPSDLSPQEKRLATFCRLFAVVYALGALGFAITPRLTFRLVTLDAVPVGWTPQAVFWNVLAVSMMAAIATACLVTAARPRERRHALLPVIVAKLTSSALAAAHLLRMPAPASRAVAAIILTDFPLFVLTLLFYRAAAPGVHSEPAREGPPPETKPVQLGVTKG